MKKQKIGLVVFYICFVTALIAMPLVTIWAIPILLVGGAVYFILPHGGYGSMLYSMRPKTRRIHMTLLCSGTALLTAFLWMTDLIRVTYLAQLPGVYMMTHIVALWLWDIHQVEKAEGRNAICLPGNEE